MDVIQFFILFIFAILSSIVGSAAGGGGAAVTYFGLFLTGFPTHIAIGTHKLGDLGHYIFTLRNYYKNKKTSRSIVLPLALLGFIGAGIGSLIVISISENILNKIVAVILAITLIVIFIRKNIGVKKSSKSFLWAPSYFFISIYEGFFGAASGIFSVLSLTSFKGLTFTEAIGNHKFAGVFMSFISVIIFIKAGLVNYFMAIPLFLGSLIGGHIGSKIALKKGDTWVRSFLIVVILLTILLLLFR